MVKTVGYSNISTLGREIGHFLQILLNFTNFEVLVKMEDFEEFTKKWGNEQKTLIFRPRARMLL